MSKGFVLYNSCNQAIKVFVIPEEQMHMYNLAKLCIAAEKSGRYGMLVEIEQIDAFGAVQALEKLNPEC
jgi:hypothetical protein